MTLQNVTVIIPAHNRPERLRRLLDYYSRTDIKVLVPDSSDHPLFVYRSSGYSEGRMIFSLYGE